MHLTHIWAYLIGEFAGGIIGALAYNAIGKTREITVPAQSTKYEQVSA